MVCDSFTFFFPPWSWQFWRILARYFVDCPFIWVCLMFSYDETGIMCLGKNKEQRLSARLMTSYQIVHNNPHDLWLVILDLASLFLSCKVTLFPFPYFLLWKQVTKSSSHWKGKEPRREEYLHVFGIFSLRKICLFCPISLIQLFRSVWMYIFYTFSHNLLLHSFLLLLQLFQFRLLSDQLLCSFTAPILLLSEHFSFLVL